MKRKHSCPLDADGEMCGELCALYSEEHDACTLALPGLLMARAVEALERIAPKPKTSIPDLVSMPANPATFLDGVRKASAAVRESLRLERAAATGGDEE